MPCIHYAVQVCDHTESMSSTRWVSNDRTLISKKSIASLLRSIKQARSSMPDVSHHVIVFTDRCTADLDSWLREAAATSLVPGLDITVEPLGHRSGKTASIRTCYQWLTDNGRDLVYQVQDDYIFQTNAIAECFDVWCQIRRDSPDQAHAIVQPYNHNELWRQVQYTQNNLLVLPARYRYWIQIYDITCSFMTSHQQFIQHWDIYEQFFCLMDQNEQLLEAKSLNKILCDRHVLGITPIIGLSYHLDQNRDPYDCALDLWNSIDV
jgi:hypothetical protein